MRGLLALVILDMVLATGAVYAQYAAPPIGPGSILPIGPSAGSGGSSPPLAPCNNGKLDFSVATGCNLTFYMIGVT
jgi:hypothetical protein